MIVKMIQNLGNRMEKIHGMCNNDLKELKSKQTMMSNTINEIRASLVAQWLRICLPRQGTHVRALIWEDPTCHGATKPVHHNN